MENSYHNTNKESGETLVKSESKASKQEKIIYDFYKENSPLHYSPEYVWKNLLKLAPLTSVRRAITNLTTKGDLEKLDDVMVPGMYGKMIHTWRYKQKTGQITIPL